MLGPLKKLLAIVGAIFMGGTIGNDYPALAYQSG